MPNESTDWLVMVYISADGLIANFAVESLKQLKRAAGNGVVAVARLGTDGIGKAKRYVFNQINDLSPLDSKAEAAEPSEGVKIPSATDLSDFINQAVEIAPHAKHHALFLWGHGPELLSEEEPKSVANNESKKNSDQSRIYLTPSELRDALKETVLTRFDHKLDIIGLDACSMSMAELASELGKYAEFMVASQDDVPDMSFPYQAILPQLRELDTAEEASKMILDEYGKAYCDYLTNPRTGLRAITMSAIALNKEKMDRIIMPLTKLAGLLLELSKREETRGEILTARQKSQGFVFGLFVDIVDLCEQLQRSNIYNDELKKTCTDIQNVIGTNEVVITKTAETADGPAAHGRVATGGLSVYFPYRIPDEIEKLQELRAKGSKDHPTKERIQRIHELERDFAELQDTWVKTGWNKFIQEGWSSILANEAKPRQLVLDDVYSAQQCAQNLGSVRQGNSSARLDRQTPTTAHAKPSLVEMHGSSEQPPAVNQ